jgi:predicted dehydrogenase
MRNIGIVGSDNSHALIFTKLLNQPGPTGAYAYPDLRVRYLFGTKEEENAKVVAEGGGLIEVVGDPSAMLGKADAVMTVFRHGDLHAPHCLPFIEAGVPTWVDKPFAIANRDARAMLDAAKARGTLLTGGSTTKYTPDVATLRTLVSRGSRLGRIRAASMNFQATTANEYGGLPFYGSHLVEIALTVFGTGVRSVVAADTAGTVTAILRYDGFPATLQFIPGQAENHVTIWGEKGVSLREIDITACYADGMREFVRMLDEKAWPLTPDFLFASTAVMSAILESVATGRPVDVETYGA